MSKSRTSSSSSFKETYFYKKLYDYSLLVKFKLTLLVVFSTVVPFIAGSEELRWDLVFWLGLSGFLITGAANALNEVFEKDFDKLMPRTLDRPLAAGRMEVQEAVLAAGLMSLVGLSVISIFFNPLAGLVATLSLVIYAFVYTPMKRVGPVAVWIGAVPGAFPMMIGWVAATGDLGVEAWLLFSLQFFWQFPHFWAIAWVKHEDYTKGGYRLIPSSGEPDRVTAAQALLYSVMLIPLTFLAWEVSLLSTFSTGVLSLVTLHYIWSAWRLYRSCDKADALKLMFSSFLYLPVLLFLLIGDKIF